MGKTAPAPAMPTFSWMMLLPLVVVFVSKQIFDFENEEDVEFCRTVYMVMHGSVLCCLGYMYTKAKANAQVGIVKTTEKAAFGAVEDEPDTPKEQSVAEYDVAQVFTQLQQLGLGMCITTFIAYKWNLAIPLVLQSVTNPLQMYQGNLFKVYILGERAPKRPWADPTKQAGIWNKYKDMKKQIDDMQRDAQGLAPRKSGKERRAINKKKVRQN